MRTLISFLLSFFLLVSPVYSSNWCRDAQVGGCWTYEEGSGDPDDQSPNNNDGTISGTVTWQTATPPDTYSSAYLDFDGSDDYVSVGQMGSFGTTIRDQDAVSGVAWIKTSDTTNRMAIFGTVNDGANTIISFQVNTTTNEAFNAHDIYLNIRDEDGNSVNKAVSLAGGVCDGSWHHLAFSAVPSTNSITFWLDTVEQSESVGLANTPDNLGDFDYPLTHGARNARGTYDYDFDGELDDVAIFSRTLSQSDVESIYNYGLTQSGAQVITNVYY